MRLEIRIFDDQDQVVAEYKGDPSQPGQWRAQPGQRLVSKMPAQSDNQNTGTYELAGFTYQPHVRVERPNGYTSPVPSPNNGLPSGFPTIGLGQYQPRPLVAKGPSVFEKWSQVAPTVSPAPSANSIQESKL